VLVSWVAKEIVFLLGQGLELGHYHCLISLKSHLCAMASCQHPHPALSDPALDELEALQAQLIGVRTEPNLKWGFCLKQRPSLLPSPVTSAPIL